MTQINSVRPLRVRLSLHVQTTLKKSRKLIVGNSTIERIAVHCYISQVAEYASCEIMCSQIRCATSRTSQYARR